MPGAPATNEPRGVVQRSEHWMAALNLHERRRQSLTEHFHGRSLLWFLTHGQHESHGKEVESLRGEMTCPR